MKSKIDITLSTLHIGTCQRVVTLSLNGRDYAQDFLQKLHKDDYRKWRSIYARITSVANYDSYENQITFRHIEDGLFEFKRGGLRLYAFYHSLHDQSQLILCTNGGNKNTRKQQNSDIQRAQFIKQQFMDAILEPQTNITIR